MKTPPLTLTLSLTAAILGGCMNDASKAADPSQNSQANPPGMGARAGQEMDDGLLTTKVKTALATHDSLKTLVLHVDSNNGVVTISGNVQNQDQYDAVSRVVLA